MCCNSDRASYAPITNKADALQFAILVTMNTRDIPSKVDYAAAQKLYDFICQNATFADDERIAVMKEATGLLNELKEQIANNDPIGRVLKAAREDADILAGLQFTPHNPGSQDN